MFYLSTDRPLCLLLLVPLLLGCFNVRSLPDGLAYAGPERRTDHVQFLRDMTWADQDGTRHVDQQIFDEFFRLINGAEHFIYLDMFLYNDFQGETPETNRSLSRELTDALVSRRQEKPDMVITVMTDPINTVYGGMPSMQFEQLRDAGITVVETNLDVLRDSNPCFSLPWRLLVKPFGVSRGKLMPNPFGEGRVSVRSWLKMLNFKANHRKLLVVDDGDTVTALVTSANAHDASSAHRNTGVVFTGEAALDLLESEMPLFDMGGLPRPEWRLPAMDAPAPPGESGAFSLRVLTERAIKDAALQIIGESESGSRLDLAMFYLSDRAVIAALKQAGARGVQLRVLLDPNKDAFGWRKNGIPNRQVAAELFRAGVPVRWCDTRGEQCHSKTLVNRQAGRVRVLLGSANYTRRNLNNYNLETNVLVTAPEASDFAAAVSQWFGTIWHNDPGRQFSVGYDVYAEDSKLKSVVYRFQEASGMSTF